MEAGRIDKEIEGRCGRGCERSGAGPKLERAAILGLERARPGAGGDERRDKQGGKHDRETGLNELVRCEGRRRLADQWQAEDFGLVDREGRLPGDQEQQEEGDAAAWPGRQPGQRRPAPMCLGAGMNDVGHAVRHPRVRQNKRASGASGPRTNSRSRMSGPGLAPISLL